MVKLIPLEKYHYMVSPLTEVMTELVNGTEAATEIYRQEVIEVSQDDLNEIGVTKKFQDGNVVAMTEEEKAERKNLLQGHDTQELKITRQEVMGLYNMYQTAVIYGQFEKDFRVDGWIKRLMDQDWEMLKTVPAQLNYFAGKVSFEQSGLIKGKGW